jgi:predicted ATP-dependent protease
VARVIEHAARLASDAHRLSIHLRSIADLLCEADACAGVAGRAIATAPDVEAALAGQERRAGRMRERMLEEVTRGTVLIATSGVAVGQLNGLSVIDAGGHAFGFPTRISARARVGGGDVVDIEREVALGGPLHSKGVLILAGLLGARYAPHMPLALSASIVFEQSYGAVEGDSASLAELCVLLSAIGEVPVRQGLALTGSINQHGEVQAIGGVNEKIEGFFDVCAARGLTGDQGVIIPRANVPHLMLRADVVAAVAAGRFHVHAVADVDEALALLTDRAAGAREASGHFARGSVNAQIEARLAAFADDARRFSRDRGERPHRVSSMPN